MRTWHDFLDSLDSDGGKILILLILMLVGAIFATYMLPKAEDIIVGAFGALLMSLKVSGSNKDRREGPPMPLPTSAGASPVAVVVPEVVGQPVAEAVVRVADAIDKASDKEIGGDHKDS